MQSDKTLMIIGASWEQIPLIKAAREKCQNLIITDSNPKAEGFLPGCTHETLDPRDLPSALELALRHEIDGVVSDQCDYSRYASVFITAFLGIGRANIPAAQLTTNKAWMRECCELAGILQPSFQKCKTFEKVEEAFDTLRSPVVIKPVDNRGSYGVSVLKDKAGLRNAYLVALANSHSREIMVESFVEGTHVTVDGCVDQQGNHVNLALATKKILDGPAPLIHEVCYPGRLPEATIKHVYDVNSAVVQAVGISDGLTHAEYIVDGAGQCYLVEIANRGGGVLTSGCIVPFLTNVDVSDLLVANALGEDFVIKPEFNGGAVILHFFIFSPGKVASISGINAVREMQGVEEVKLFFEVGQNLSSPTSGASRHGFCIVTGKTRKEAEELLQTVKDSIVVGY